MAIAVGAAALGALGIIAYRILTQHSASKEADKAIQDKTTNVWERTIEQDQNTSELDKQYVYALSGSDAAELDYDFPIHERRDLLPTKKQNTSELDEQDVWALDGSDAAELDEYFPIDEYRHPIGSAANRALEQVQGKKDSVSKHFEVFGGIS